MVVKMMRWRPWPPLLSKKFEVRLIVRSLEVDSAFGGESSDKERVFTVEIRWKGPKIALGYFRKTLKRNLTREERVTQGSNGVVQWDEVFQCVCSLPGYKDNVFHPWEITFTVLNDLSIGSKNKPPVFGVASLNLAEYAAEGSECELRIPLAVSGSAADSHPSLYISLSLLELRTATEPTDSVQRSMVPVSSPPTGVENLSTEKDELSALKAGLRKVKIFKDYVSARRAKKAFREEEDSEGRFSSRSEEGDYTYPFDSDSLDDFDERESDENKEDSSVRKSFSYGTLAYANYAGSSYYDVRINGKDENLIYYSNRKSDVGCSSKEDSTASVSIPYAPQNVKRSILPWRKRKLSFRSPKAKGEPLIKKDCREEGGDDIDFDRRQLSSDESLSFWWQKTDEDSSANRSSVSEFGDDNFAVGLWEQKVLTCRDGLIKLQTQVFFASIDQRSEQAAGESACTVLVAVIADWLQNNHDNPMPIKSQFDSLIREGSLEWRNLCENETYKERFPDKHFDLETVLQDKIFSLGVVPGKSFVGFFHPDGMDEGSFDFLHGAMSFDSIWDEISDTASECKSNGESHVYIVSWNDHFFILKVDQEAYYIIDTLGERLYEGCNQAYILKFDKNTTICKLSSTLQSSEDKPTGNLPVSPAAVGTKNKQTRLRNPGEETSVAGPEGVSKGEREEVLCQGKEACKEYIKSFLAAIPIRELQADIKRGLISSTPLHQRLQIEFHYTQLAVALTGHSAMEISMATPYPLPQPAEVAVAEVAA